RRAAPEGVRFGRRTRRPRPAAAIGSPALLEQARTEGLQDPRVYVGRTANRRGVPELLGDSAHRAGDRAFCLAVGLWDGLSRKLPHRADRAVPGAEILRREVTAGRFANVRIDL